ncbi:MAG: Coenzyme F420 hydrogenase/dehydrogenase, beta subunit C-terminal domain [Deltaproteobacteria bacterium]|nr:Coenzyme F420 hydrogenase/dehydrogenase, beta subunit C-terminal domain [Deltaproteobacteria bacterium]MBW2352886.1 Coenzyme F420 hydrogenase/dehydrogenase, beta subunit C-terminal domain [Deltaproteobacteria bacterium]
MNGGLNSLRERVIDPGLCVACGACVGLCPYLRSWHARTVRLDDCDLEEGRCFDYCPRGRVDLDELHQGLFGGPYEDVEVGRVRRVFMARAADPLWEGRVQNGGVVSALIDFALREGVIQGAVLTGRDRNLLPGGIIARNREDIMACAGSAYTSGPTLEALNRGPWNGEERIGIVGLPCTVMALARMKTSALEKRTPIDRVDLIIGLFCTWALDYERFSSFLRERFKDRPIGKVDITPPPERLMKITAGDEQHNVAIDEIRPFIRPGCLVCHDMTSEFSHISVGTVEGEEGWNTVVVRTETGEELVGRAEKEGVIQARPLSRERLDHLREASLLKKRRAITALKERGELEEGYLSLSHELMGQIQSGSREGER